MAKGTKYSQQFKEDAVQYRLDHPDLPLRKAAENLGVSESALKNWMKAAKEHKGEVPTRGSGNYASEEAKEIARLCKSYHVPFVINDNVDIALEIDADGVHVGQSDMEAGDVRAKLGPDKIIGVSAQTVGQALLAQERGADYLGVGAVFHTDSKADAADISHETLKAITEAVDIPVIAIGGISKENVSELSGTGICGIAVISAIFAEKDIKNATKKLKKLTEEMVEA